MSVVFRKVSGLVNMGKMGSLYAAYAAADAEEARRNKRVRRKFKEWYYRFGHWLAINFD